MKSPKWWKLSHYTKRILRIKYRFVVFLFTWRLYKYLKEYVFIFWNPFSIFEYVMKLICGMDQISTKLVLLNLCLQLSRLYSTRQYSVNKQLIRWRWPRTNKIFQKKNLYLMPAHRDWHGLRSSWQEDKKFNGTLFGIPSYTSVSNFLFWWSISYHIIRFKFRKFTIIGY